MRLRPDIEQEPFSALASLLIRAGMTGPELAIELGVSRTTVRSWENGHYDPPSRLLRRMALILGCGVHEILNGQTPPSRLEEWVERWNTDAPFEAVVKLRFSGGGEYEYPLSRRARLDLSYALKSRGRVAWVGFNTTDRRLVFLNAPRLEALSTAPAGSAQPRAKNDSALVETIDSRHLSLLPNEALFETIELLLRVSESPDAIVDIDLMNDWLVGLSASDSTSLEYRLGSLALLDVPLEPYVDAMKRAIVARATRSERESESDRPETVVVAARRRKAAKRNGSARPSRAR